MRIDRARFAAEYAEFKTDQALTNRQYKAARDWAGFLARDLHHTTLDALLNGLLDQPETHETIAIIKVAQCVVAEETRMLEERRAKHQRIEIGLRNLASMVGLDFTDFDDAGEHGHA